MDVFCMPVVFIKGATEMAEERMVSKEQGVEFAREHGCMYHETSACTSDDNVHDALVWGLVAGILDNEELVRAYHHDKLEQGRLRSQASLGHHAHMLTHSFSTSMHMQGMIGAVHHTC
ncbi:hypothetical protein HaLaN_19340 [Haematococcus lacustris]|uniref:Uncharacterized protein n=1 Tax=Haematococcus lacustris TaxID=44745 RepID=A0A699ZLJ9_HAELA|nr:hypothetical protein HaLaN_19340 [Haematococcus lacustris]